MSAGGVTTIAGLGRESHIYILEVLPSHTGLWYNRILGDLSSRSHNPTFL